jgi:hypothetical protein
MVDKMTHEKSSRISRAKAIEFAGDSPKVSTSCLSRKFFKTGTLSSSERWLLVVMMLECAAG